MAIERERVFKLLQEIQAETRFREPLGDMVIKHRGKTRFLDLKNEYKVRDIRHLAGQFNIPPDILKKHIPEC